MQNNNVNVGLGLIILAITLIVAPFTVSLYKVDFLTMLLINIILAVSFRVITTTGGWSLAHVPMMGVGAYATALMTGKAGLSFWLCLPLAGLASGIIGLAISYPLARTKGFSFFVASFAAGEAIRLCWARFKIPFGGHRGLEVPIPEGIPGIASVDFSEAIPYYFLTLVVTTICLSLMYRLDKSRIGDTMKAIQSQEAVAKSVGIYTDGYKMLAFSIGSFFAGIAGVLLAHRLWAIEPQQFGFTSTLYLLVWVVFGGSATFAGPIIGVVLLTLVGEALRPLAEWVPMFYGIIIILTLIFLPHGVESLPNRLGFSIRKIWRIRISFGE